MAARSIAYPSLGARPAEPVASTEMSLLRTTARAIRHAPPLESMNWLWDRVRKPYQFLIDPTSKGVAVMLGGVERIHIPARFTGYDWERYEPATVRRVAQWVREHPAGIVLDIGASHGIYARLVLTISARARVIAFESNVPSLKGLELMCQGPGRDSLLCVHGFISEHHDSELTLDAAVARTSALLAATAEPSASDVVYTLLDVPPVEEIPSHSIDGFLDARSVVGHPTLVKCDIEGAELLALRGARRFLTEVQPALSLSVHPDRLKGFGHSVENVAELLMSLGYSVTLLESDWEEHWWCAPNKNG
jgi:FkbM family methyltransferase